MRTELEARLKSADLPFPDDDEKGFCEAFEVLSELLRSGGAESGSRITPIAPLTSPRRPVDVVVPPVVMTLTEASEAMASGDLTSTALCRAMLERLHALDPKVHSFVHVAAEAALEAAEEADRRRLSGAMIGRLHGMPIGIKDIFDVAGMPTTGQSRVLGLRPAVKDSAAVARLRNAGAVILGKLNTHEFAFWGPCDELPVAPSRNPWDTTRYTGGSSSGCGAAVAAGFCLGALGSDTGGSIRTPAALCGLAGFKPTRGLISVEGMLPLSPSLDHAGPMAWTVADCALLTDCLLEPDGAGLLGAHQSLSSALTGDIRGIRVGVLDDDELAGLDPEIARAHEAVTAVLSDLGADVQRIALPSLWECQAAGIVILLAEAYAIHQERLRRTPYAYGCHMRSQIMLGALIGAEDYRTALLRRDRLVDRLAASFADTEIVLAPTHARPAQPVEMIGKYGFAREPFRTMPFNLNGAPAISLCAGFTESGLPIGMQIVGRPRSDSTVLNVGDAYERASGWLRLRLA